jgi:hypothetical protein
MLGLIARIAEWDVLLCFDFSRLARGSEDLGWVRNRLRVEKRTAFEASSGLDLFNVDAELPGRGAAARVTRSPARLRH